MRLSEAAERGFARHESFYPRYGWFRKAYAAAAQDTRIFTREDAPAQIGVGINMVNAIRFWGLAAKLIERESSAPRSPDIIPARLGTGLFGENGWDRYAEAPGTLWLIHWLLLAPPCLLPVWWVVFNDFHAPEFTLSDLQEAVIDRLEKESDWEMPNASSVKKDIRVLLQTYGPPGGSRHSGRRIYCPLRELNLIVPSPLKDHYRFKWGLKATLPSEIVAYAALDYLSRTRAAGGAVSLRQLAHDPCSPGRVFKLSETELAAALEPTVEQNRRFGLITLAGDSHLVWSTNPALIARAVLDDYYYRVWHGPDVDVRQLLDIAGQQVQDRSLADILSEVDDPQPMVAARHSALRDTLRVFSKRYVDGSAEVDPPGPFSTHDGEVLLVANTDGSPPRLPPAISAAKPVVAALPKDVSDLEAAARAISAASLALADPTVEGDWAARRVLRERRTRAQGVFEQALVAAFGADSCRWVLLGAGGGADMELAPGRGSAALSDAADISYPDAPQVGNEMLNSNSLTANGKRARRKLLEAMVEHGDRDGLGLEGFGPEVAMYRAFLKRTGLHRRDPDHRMWRFRRPTDESLRPAWQILENQFRRARYGRVNLREAHAALQLPPVGMKAGAVPVFITAGLLAVGDKVALYERGAFRSLTPELPQRIADHPGHFTIGSPSMPQG